MQEIKVTHVNLAEISAAFEANPNIEFAVDIPATLPPITGELVEIETSGYAHVVTDEPPVPTVTTTSRGYVPKLPLIMRLLQRADLGKYKEPERILDEAHPHLLKNHPLFAILSRQVVRHVEQCRKTTQRIAEGRVVTSHKGLPKDAEAFQKAVYREMAQIEFTTAQRLAKKAGMRSRYVPH